MGMGRARAREMGRCDWAAPEGDRIPALPAAGLPTMYKSLQASMSDVCRFPCPALLMPPSFWLQNHALLAGLTSLESLDLRSCLFNRANFLGSMSCLKVGCRRLPPAAAVLHRHLREF
jgi:hypothetical protein